jgi:hypothetical protein
VYESAVNLGIASSKLCTVRVHVIVLEAEGAGWSVRRRMEWVPLSAWYILKLFGGVSCPAALIREHG